MSRVAVNEFVRRQTADSRFSHYDGTFEEVVAMAEAKLDSGRVGYRDGVLEVDVDPAGFYTSIAQLKEGDMLVGRYEARCKGESPRMHIEVVGSRKMPAKAVTLILYRHDVLLEDNKNSTDAEWELISINARPTVGPEPINPGALMANHFGADGGTDTQMTPEAFEIALRESWKYWRNKRFVGGSKSDCVKMIQELADQIEEDPLDLENIRLD